LEWLEIQFIIGRKKALVY